MRRFALVWAAFGLSLLASAEQSPAAAGGVQSDAVVACLAENPEGDLFSCIRPQVELCLGGIPAVYDPACIVEASAGLARQTDEIVASYSARYLAENAGKPGVSALSEITVRRAREVYALECRFNEEWMAVGAQDARPFDPRQNGSLAICLFNAEAYALARLRVFPGDENADLF